MSLDTRNSAVSPAKCRPWTVVDFWQYFQRSPKTEKICCRCPGQPGPSQTDTQPLPPLVCPPGPQPSGQCSESHCSRTWSGCRRDLRRFRHNSRCSVPACAWGSRIVSVPLSLCSRQEPQRNHSKSTDAFGHNLLFLIPLIDLQSLLLSRRIS